MDQPQSTTNNSSLKKSKSKMFSDLSIGLFFLVSSASLLIAMYMFVVVWQPIWQTGFKDFHTITSAINKLNKTAQPASASVPLMLSQMADMNDSMLDMKFIMKDMHGSIQKLEGITPNIEKMTTSVEKMNTSVENMTMVMNIQLNKMTYVIDQMENKLSPFGMMPFNW